MSVGRVVEVQRVQQRVQGRGGVVARARGRRWGYGPVLALGLALLSGAPPLSASPADAAQEPSAEELERARQHFAEGKARMDEGAWSEAAASFRKAAQVKDTPGLRYHVAFCEENAGHFVAALAEYRMAKELLEVRPAPDVADLLGPAMERVERKIAKITLELERPVTPRRVELDGVVLEDWSLVRLDPGVHSVRVEAPGYLPFVTEVSLEPGEERAIQVRLVEPEPMPEPTVEEPTKSPWRVPAIVTGAALSVAGAGLGVWGLLERSSAQREVRSATSTIRDSGGGAGACVDAAGPLRTACAELGGALDRRDRATALAVGGFAALGVGAGVTVVSLFFWPERPVQVTATASYGGAGVSLGGSF